MQEFSIIEQYFKNQTQPRRDVLIGVGDDCAITAIPPNHVLATTTDTLVSGVHFLPDTAPADIAQKALAVNLSDLAAVGATPAWINLALTLPSTNEEWLADFSDAFARMCEYYGVNLIGGDTTRGPLSITLTAQGFVPAESVATRSGAQPGDYIYVTGTLGDAGAGLAVLKGELSGAEHAVQYAVARHLNPTPRVLAGTSLRRNITSCIDISDGLIGDLKHILTASSVGAVVRVEDLPLSPAMTELVSLEHAYELALGAGDDYELLFTINEAHLDEVLTELHSVSIAVTCIGQITGQKGLELKLHNQAYLTQTHSYQHEIPLDE